MMAGNTPVSQDHMLSTSSLCPRCVNASKIDLRHQETNHTFACSHPYLNTVVMVVRLCVESKDMPSS